jgi:hypothetical protein
MIHGRLGPPANAQAVFFVQLFGFCSRWLLKEMF